MVLLSHDLKGGANYAVFAAGIGVTFAGVFMITSAAAREKAQQDYDSFEDELELVETGGAGHHLQPVPENVTVMTDAEESQQSVAIHREGG